MLALALHGYFLEMVLRIIGDGIRPKEGVDGRSELGQVVGRKGRMDFQIGQGEGAQVGTKPAVNGQTATDGTSLGIFH